MKRTLTLRRETLSELSADDLAGVAAGAIEPRTRYGGTCPLLRCPSQLIYTCETRCSY